MLEVMIRYRESPWSVVLLVGLLQQTTVIQESISRVRWIQPTWTNRYTHMKAQSRCVNACPLWFIIIELPKSRSKFHIQTQNTEFMNPSNSMSFNSREVSFNNEYSRQCFYLLLMNNDSVFIIPQFLKSIYIYISIYRYIYISIYIYMLLAYYHSK